MSKYFFSWNKKKQKKAHIATYVESEAKEYLTYICLLVPILFERISKATVTFYYTVHTSQ